MKHRATLLFRQRPQTRRLIVHCSHTGPDIPRLTEHLRAKGRALGLLEVGYHFIIERDGWLDQTRDMEVMGSHAPGNNHDSVGVCLALRGHGEYPTDAQRRTLRHLLSAIREAHPQVGLWGHDEISRFKPGHDACPGFPMDRLREDCALPPHPLHPEHETHRMDDEGPAPKLSTQCTILLDYLRSGRHVSNMIALVSLGIGSLSSRVAELRAHGYDVAGESKLDTNGRRYNSYSLEA